jgi:hypothetical protein
MPGVVYVFTGFIAVDVEASRKSQKELAGEGTETF